MVAPTHIISILTPDRRGIIHGIVKTLKQEEVQHLEISQTVVHGSFTIAIVLWIPPDHDADSVAAALQVNLGDQASVTLQDYHAADRAYSSDTRERFILTAIGTAVSGVVQSITGIILDRGGNFTDFSSQVIDDRLQLLAEVDLPEDVALDQLQIDLKHACDDPDLQVRLLHSRLFHATTDVAFRRKFHA
jgi:ACT domain-containing protein